MNTACLHSTIPPPGAANPDTGPQCRPSHNSEPTKAWKVNTHSFVLIFVSTNPQFWLPMVGQSVIARNDQWKCHKSMWLNWWCKCLPYVSNTCVNRLGYRVTANLCKQKLCKILHILHWWFIRMIWTRRGTLILFDFDDFGGRKTRLWRYEALDTTRWFLRFPSHRWRWWTKRLKTKMLETLSEYVRMLFCRHFGVLWIQRCSGAEDYCPGRREDCGSTTGATIWLNAEIR